MTETQTKYILTLATTLKVNDSIMIKQLQETVIKLLAR